MNTTTVPRRAGGSVMFKKSSVLRFGLFISIFAVNITVCLADVNTELNRARDNVYALIEAGKLNEARAAKNRLLADFNNEPNLPEVWHLIAVQYERVSNFEEAKSNFQQIIQNYPDNPFANKARLGISRAEAMSFIMSERFDQAKAAVDKMAVDFAGNPELPAAIYWIAERYQRMDKFEEAKQIYQRIIENYPNNPYVNKAKFWLSRTNVTSLIVSGNYSAAQEALDKLITDFANSPDLPGALFWITERYERANRFEEAKQNYQRIIRNYPDCPYVERAKLGASRAEAMSLIASKDFDKAREAIDKLAVDFANSPDLPGTLYWLTERYVWVDKLDEARPVCQRIIQNYPDSPYAGRAKLRGAIADVAAFIYSQDYNAADAAFDIVVADFKEHQDLPLAAVILGQMYYRRPNAEESAARAKRIFQIAIDKMPLNVWTPEAHFWMGACYNKLGQYEEAIAYYRRSCDGFAQYGCSPGSRFDNGCRSESLYMIGQSYQELIKIDAISNETAEPLIIESYERVVNEFPDSFIAKNAWRELGRLYASKNQSQDAIRCLEAYLKIIPEERCPADVFYKLARAYDETGNAESAKKNYTRFLTLAASGDPLREDAKARLSAMENADGQDN